MSTVSIPMLHTGPHANRSTETPTQRQSMESIARVLRLSWRETPNSGLACRIASRVPATIAPRRNNRLVAMFRVAAAHRVPRSLWKRALSEAAAWGLSAERQRFVVADGSRRLLWITPPLHKRGLLDQLNELFATAVALAAESQTTAQAAH
jgi:hypothetical protein